MKKIKLILSLAIFIAISLAFFACSSDNDSDGDGSSIFINSSSSLRQSDASSSSRNSISSSSISSYSGSYGSVSYGGQTYKTVVIGTQTWMAENLNYNASGSTCYNGVASNCTIYGRLYNWATAMNLSSTCNRSSCSGQVQSNHKGICPSGWHIPSNEDWDKLFRFVDGDNGTESPYSSSTAGRYLKATSGWNNNGNGTNSYGFAALPGGDGDSGGNFLNIGYFGCWWSASEYDGSNAYRQDMGYIYWNARYDNSNKSNLFSVRCVKD